MHARIEVRVPSRMRFVDLRLRITSDARAEIQKKVDSLTRSEWHYGRLLERVNLFFPLIRTIFKQEKVPLDLQYLIIQESGLVGDHVSVTQDVGFWQFQKLTALEMNLHIDHHIDERMSLVAATRSAARFLKKHNDYFQNWYYALLAYNRGRRGARKFFDPRMRGKRWMRIDHNTPRYIIHFLAHKLAFERTACKAKHPTHWLDIHTQGHGKTLHELSKELKTPKALLQEYNPWLKHEKARVPLHKECAIVVPKTHNRRRQRRRICLTPTPAKSKSVATKKAPLKPSKSIKKEAFRPIPPQSKTPLSPQRVQAYQKAMKGFPALKGFQGDKPPCNQKITINGITGIIAGTGVTLTRLARIGNLPFERFLACNEIAPEEVSQHRVKPGTPYYLATKHWRAGTHHHIVQPNDTWWTIAQRYGMRKQQLLEKNRLRKETPLKQGRLLWMRHVRPKKIPIAYVGKP